MYAGRVALNKGDVICTGSFEELSAKLQACLDAGDANFCLALQKTAKSTPTSVQGKSTPADEQGQRAAAESHVRLGTKRGRFRWGP
jgi:hypothetical protein